MKRPSSSLDATKDRADELKHVKCKENLRLIILSPTSLVYSFIKDEIKNLLKDLIAYEKQNL